MPAAAFILAAVILAMTPVCAAVLIVLWRSRRAKASGEEFELVGRMASVEMPLTPEGSVLVGGELWPARAVGPAGRVGRGRLNVRVVGADGHFLEVEST